MIDPDKLDKSMVAGVFGPSGLVRGYFDNFPLMDNALSAEDVREAKLDRDAFGRIFPEIRLAVALQILRSIRDEQIGASSAVKALAQATIEVIDG